MVRKGGFGDYIIVAPFAPRMIEPRTKPTWYYWYDYKHNKIWLLTHWDRAWQVKHTNAKAVFKDYEASPGSMAYYLKQMVLFFEEYS